MRSPSAVEKRVGVVVGEIAAGGARPAARARASVVESTIAPAASVGPSMPSVPTLASAAGAPTAASASRQRERELLIAPARARARDVDRRLAARHDARRARQRWRRVPAPRASAPAPARALADHRRRRCAARDSRALAASARAPAIASRRPPMTRASASRQPRVAGLRRLRHAPRDAGREMRDDRRRIRGLAAERREHVERVGERASHRRRSVPTR